MAFFSRPSEWQYSEKTCHELGHTWNSSCTLSQIHFFLIVTYEGVKLYLPLYLVSELMKRRRLREMWKVVPHVLRSALFLGTNGGTTFFILCLVRRIIGRFYMYTSVFLPCMVGAACALLVERKSRRPLLAGYVATVAIDLVYCMLKHRKMISPLPYGEVFLFSMASAILFHRYRTGPSVKGDLVNSVLSALLSPQFPLPLQSLLQFLPLDNRVANILMVGIWAFLIGYFIQTSISLLGQYRELFTTRGYRVITNSENIKFGLFVSTLATGYKVVNCLLYYLPVPRNLRLLLAGLVAGMSMLFYRSSSLSLYVAWKALEVLYSKGVERRWLKYIPHGEVFIYAVSTALLFHGCFFESHNMRLSYWNFLRRVTRGKILEFNYNELDMFGTGASTRIKQWRNRKATQLHQ